LLGAAKRTLDGEDRSERIAEEGKAGRKIGEKWSAILVPWPAASDIRCLLVEFRQYHGLFLLEDLDQEGLWVQRADTPRHQMLWPEVAKGGSKMIAASLWTAAATTWRSFSSFVILGISDS
jgi:hypothetical protein